MSVTVDWDAAQHAIIIAVHDIWSWNDYRASANRVLTLLDAAADKVTIIHNMDDSSYMPNHGLVENLRHAAQTYHSHPNTHTIITITLSNDIRYLFEQIWRRYGAAGRAYLSARSLEDAYRLMNANSS